LEPEAPWIETHGAKPRKPATPTGDPVLSRDKSSVAFFEKANKFKSIIIGIFLCINFVLFHNISTVHPQSYPQNLLAQQ